MPEIDFPATAARSIHMAPGDADPIVGGRVLLYARSVTGGWFGLRLMKDGPDAGRHTCRGEDEGMTPKTCAGVAW